MLISQVVKHKGDQVFAVSPGQSLEAAARELAEKRVGALLVIEEGKVVGILSERDVVRELAGRGADALAQLVSEVMTPEVISASPKETVDTLLGRMTDRRIRHLPVVDGSGALCGVVSIGDLVKHKINEVEAEAQTLKNYIAAG